MTKICIVKKNCDDLELLGRTYTKIAANLEELKGSSQTEMVWYTIYAQYPPHLLYNELRYVTIVLNENF